MNNWSGNFSSSCEKFCVFPKLKQLVNGKSKGDVEVNFIKFKEVEDNIVAEVEVINNSPNSIYYAGNENGKNVYETTKFNDLEAKQGIRCGTGLSRQSTYHLHSGESLKMKVHEPLHLNHI
jgi:hypothetical protein